MGREGKVERVALERQGRQGTTDIPVRSPPLAVIGDKCVHDRDPVPSQILRVAMIRPDPILRRRSHLLDHMIQGGEELPLDLCSGELIQWVERADRATGGREFGIEAGWSGGAIQNAASTVGCAQREHQFVLAQRTAERDRLIQLNAHRRTVTDGPGGGECRRMVDHLRMPGRSSWVQREQ